MKQKSQGCYYYNKVSFLNFDLSVAFPFNSSGLVIIISSMFNAIVQHSIDFLNQLFEIQYPILCNIQLALSRNKMAVLLLCTEEYLIHFLTHRKSLYRIFAIDSICITQQSAYKSESGLQAGQKEANLKSEWHEISTTSSSKVDHEARRASFRANSEH
ncbi:hypothetical protein GQR58_000871 [Nymphon striatum]|nr:hypothetical protein GQR58_000871 [Nymphon striatum]